MKKFLLALSLFTILTSPVQAYGTGGCDKYTVVLSHFDGPNASTTFSDEDCDGTGKHVLTAAGNAQLSTANYVFGGASALFDGTGDRITVSGSDADFTIGTADFNCDLRVMFNATTANPILFDYDVTNDNFQLQYNTVTTNKWRVRLNGTTYLFAFTASTSVWYHVVLNRSGTDLRMFVDGVQVGVTQTAADSIPASTVLIIGTDASFTNDFNGLIDEFRLVKGNSEFPFAGFQSPTTPYCSGCEMAGFLND